MFKLHFVTAVRASGFQRLDTSQRRGQEDLPIYTLYDDEELISEDGASHVVFTFLPDCRQDPVKGPCFTSSSEVRFSKWEPMWMTQSEKSSQSLNISVSSTKYSILVHHTLHPQVARSKDLMDCKHCGCLDINASWSNGKKTDMMRRNAHVLLVSAVASHSPSLQYQARQIQCLSFHVRFSCSSIPPYLCEPISRVKTV